MDRPNFQFRRREEKLDWKKLAALDVDQITKNVDYKALQDSIRQITYCDAGKEFDSEATDPNLVKVFRMSQLIIEYLLQSQDFLANNLASVEQRLNSTLEELETARQRSRRDHEELRDLRKGLRAPASSTVMTLTGHQRCQFCQKVFLNTTYLQSHMMRRHNHMVSKQMSNQTLSTVTPDQQQPSALESELEQVRRRLLVAEQQLREERRRVAALEQGTAHQPAGHDEDGSSSYHATIKEEPETVPQGAVVTPDPAPAAGSAHGSARGSGQGSAQGSRQGSGQSSAKGSAKGSAQGSAQGSGQGSGRGSRQGSGQGSAAGSDPPSAGQQDSQLALLMEQQAAEIRQLREELERQRQTMVMSAVQQTGFSTASAPLSSASQPEPSRVEQELQKQTRRDVVALEGKMEAQERYWQGKLRVMRERHDAEVEGMRVMLSDKNAGPRGSAEYVNIDSSGPEEPSPRLLRYVHRHQSPSPGPPAARATRQRPRPCIARQQRRSRSVSGYRRLKFADDDEECEEEEEDQGARGPPRESFSSDALSRNGGLGGVPRVRQELEVELSERLLELGIEPGTRRITSGLMTDKMKHLQLSRKVLGFGDLRRQVDEDVNQRLSKFSTVPSKRTSRLALFARDVMNRGADMSRSLVTLGNRGRVPSSATIDAQLMQRVVAASPAGRPRAASDSPSGRRAADSAPSWPRDDRDWDGRPQTRYNEEEDFRPRQGGRKFKFKANASKHILERFTRRGQCPSSLIKSTTIHRVESGVSVEDDGGDPGGQYERLRDEKPPAGRQGSSSSLARRASAERQASSEAGQPSAGFGMFQGSSEKVPAVRSGSVPGMPSLRPADDAEEGFITPMSRPTSGSSMERASAGSRPDSGVVPAFSPPGAGSRTPSIQQIGSDSVTPKPGGLDDSEVSNQIEPSIHTMDPVDVRPSGSANTLSTSQWNSGADGGAPADSSAAEETETRTTSSSEEETDEDETDTGSIPGLGDEQGQPGS